MCLPKRCKIKRWKFAQEMKTVRNKCEIMFILCCVWGKKTFNKSWGGKKVKIKASKPHLNVEISEMKIFHGKVFVRFFLNKYWCKNEKIYRPALSTLSRRRKILQNCSNLEISFNSISKMTFIINKSYEVQFAIKLLSRFETHMGEKSRSEKFTDARILPCAI